MPTKRFQGERCSRDVCTFTRCSKSSLPRRYFPTSKLRFLECVPHSENTNSDNSSSHGTQALAETAGNVLLVRFADWSRARAGKSDSVREEGGGDAQLSSDVAFFLEALSSSPLLSSPLILIICPSSPPGTGAGAAGSLDALRGAQATRAAPDEERGGGGGGDSAEANSHLEALHPASSSGVSSCSSKEEEEEERVALLGESRGTLQVVSNLIAEGFQFKTLMQ